MTTFRLLSWAKLTGEPLALRTEITLKSKTYWTASGAATDAQKTMSSALTPSLAAAVSASQAAHDLTGEHTWGGKNQRP